VADTHVPLQPSPLSDRELAVNFYNAARSEITQRLALREQVLLASLTVSGIVTGLAFRSGSPEYTLLCLIPLFTLPFVVAHVRHNLIIEYIGDYFRDELGLFLSGSVELKTFSGPRHWDESSNMKARMTKFLRYEALAHFFFLCGPGWFVLWLVWSQRALLGSLYWTGFVLTCIATSILFWQFVRGDPNPNVGRS